MKFFVFVYGTLKKGFSNHRLLEKSNLIGKASTCEKYPMFCSNGMYPYMVHKIGLGHSVKGEVYEVSKDVQARLDILEGVPSHYVRKEIRVKCNDEILLAWCYFRASNEIPLNIVLLEEWI